MKIISNSLHEYTCRIKCEEKAVKLRIKNHLEPKLDEDSDSETLSTDKNSESVLFSVSVHVAGNSESTLICGLSSDHLCNHRLVKNGFPGSRTSRRT